uniref:Uncharacterized protein n=1 Tax=Biomphalaria glabrata TaxID=6526 RepID=A0A2C9LCE7_BIOGL
MARNEEKQLARLNRVYLLQQKEEQLKKRPPRPKLETLTTVNEIKKWLPSVLKDIEFYVTQMEVSCYPSRQIDEFERRISQLRGEYKAFIHKIRQLEPNIDATPWTDRPYTGKQRKLGSDDSLIETFKQVDKPEASYTNNSDKKSQDVTLLETPVLGLDTFYKNCYGYAMPHKPDVDCIDPELQSKPLEFDLSKLTPHENLKQQVLATHCAGNTWKKQILSRKSSSGDKEKTNALNLQYSDSSSEEDNDRKCLYDLSTWH